MPKISIFGSLTNIQMILHTWLHGRRVGMDTEGNTYYAGKPRKGTARERRWVLYKDAPEASNVPPEGHGWLHHQTNAVPGNDNPLRRPWQKPHVPNMTGTKARYLPPSLKGEERAAATGDYTPWQPAE